MPLSTGSLRLRRRRNRSITEESFRASWAFFGYHITPEFMPRQDLLYLLQQCLDTRSEAAWEAFIREAHPLIVSGIIRAMGGWTSSRRTEIDDLVQDSFIRLCANDYRALRSFRSEDNSAFCAYLRTVAGSVATDHLRSAAAQKHGGGEAPVGLDTLTREPAITPDTVARIERGMLLRVVERCLQSHQDRDRSIFWLYHRQGLTPKAISALAASSMGQRGIETLIYRMTAAVRDCVQSVLAANNPGIAEGARG
jgi:RNA polymerase sigma-70 factor (ECF subfamily)